MRSLWIVVFALVATAAAAGQQVPANGGHRAVQGPAGSRVYDPRTQHPIVGSGSSLDLTRSNPGATAEPDAEPSRHSALAPVATPAGETQAVRPGLEAGRWDEVRRLRPSLWDARAPAQMGGMNLWWRVTVYGSQGEVLGRREFEHLVDPSSPDRDRLTDSSRGQVFGRSGATVFAEQFGSLWPTLQPTAIAWLELFGMHARMPALFVDGALYYEVSRKPVTAAGEAATEVSMRAVVDREQIGPSAGADHAGRIELVVSRASGLVLELRHELHPAGGLRRCELQDWRTVRHGGRSIEMPFRRIYVDALGRATTAVELLRAESGVELTGREFRLP
jgi:hypothetical protein